MISKKKLNVLFLLIKLNDKNDGLINNRSTIEDNILEYTIQ